MNMIQWMVAILLLGIVLPGDVWAWGYRDRLDVVIGPYWGPRYYRDYYYPPVVVERPATQIYVEQPAQEVIVERAAPSVVVDAPLPPGAISNDWYYCAKSKKYYPYVKECSEGWKKVPSKPAGVP